MVSQLRRKCHLLWHPESESFDYDSSRFLRRGNKDDRFLSFFQANESVCLLSSESGSSSEWSYAVAGKVLSTCLDGDGQRFAAQLPDKIILASFRGPFTPDFIATPTSMVSNESPCLGFNPKNSSHLAVSTGRDIRVLDVTRCSAGESKPILTIAGAAAQAHPVSFTFLTESPNVLATGWELSGNPYIRLVDIREGGGKSIKIWKSRSIHGLCGSTHLAGFSGNHVNIWDIRNQDDSLSFTCKDAISELRWSPVKSNTIGLFSDHANTIALRRLDIGRDEFVDTPIPVGAFAFTSSNDIMVCNKNNGRLECLTTRRDAIPLICPRSGAMLSVSRTGYAWTDSSRTSELFDAVKNLSRQIELQSLAEAMADNEEIDFSSRDHVHLESLSDPLFQAFMQPEIIQSTENGVFGLPVHSSPPRLHAIELLLPVNHSRLLIPLIRGDLKDGLRVLLSDATTKDDNLRNSLTAAMLSPERVPTTFESDDGASEFLVSCLDILNSNIPWGEIEALVAVIRDRQDLNVFVRAAFALTYVKSSDSLMKLLDTLKDQVPADNLRSLILTGMGNSETVTKFISTYIIARGGDGLLNVCLLGLMLGVAQHDCFKKPIQFIRNEVCNRLRGECWRLRSVIDSMINEDSAGGGSVRLVCYYCNKTLLVDSISGGGPYSNRCPHRGCHKPLPACCVCLDPLRLNAVKEEDWTVWCSTCRHGGHRDHLLTWFESFDECPVAGCNCQCSAIDGS